MAGNTIYAAHIVNQGITQVKNTNFKGAESEWKIRCRGQIRTAVEGFADLNLSSRSHDLKKL